MADGISYKDALANAENAIELWVKTARSLDREIPIAKGKLMFA
jgi:predicted RNase H-like HicB family nuclease